jgi:hypothetical protein
MLNDPGLVDYVDRDGHDFNQPAKALFNLPQNVLRLLWLGGVAHDTSSVRGASILHFTRQPEGRALLDYSGANGVPTRPTWLIIVIGLLNRLRPNPVKLGHGGRARSAGHARAMTSGLSSPSMDQTIDHMLVERAVERQACPRDVIG